MDEDAPIYNPYSRSTGRDPEVFVGRQEEIAEFRRCLRQTIAARPEWIIFYGPFGIGKTCLLRNLKRLIEGEYRERKVFSVLANFYRTSSITELLNVIQENARRQLSIHSIKKFLERLESFGFNAVSVGANITLRKIEMDAQTALLRLIQAIYDELPSEAAFVLIVDDLHLVLRRNGIPEILSLFGSIFNMEIDAGHRMMFIGTGDLRIFDTMRSHEESSVRIFNPHEIKPLSDLETEEALVKPAQNQGIYFDREVTEALYRLTEGIPYYVQVFGYYCFENREGKLITPASLDEAIPTAISSLAQRVFRGMYSGLGETKQQVLKILATQSTEPLSYSEISGHFPGEPSKEIKDLVEAGLVRKLGRGLYELRDPVFREYLKRISSEQAPG